MTIFVKFFFMIAHLSVPSLRVHIVLCGFLCVTKLDCGDGNHLKIEKLKVSLREQSSDYRSNLRK